MHNQPRKPTIACWPSADTHHAPHETRHPRTQRLVGRAPGRGTEPEPACTLPSKPCSRLARQPTIPGYALHTKRRRQQGTQRSQPDGTGTGTRTRTKTRSKSSRTRHALAAQHLPARPTLHPGRSRSRTRPTCARVCVIWMVTTGLVDRGSRQRDRRRKLVSRMRPTERPGPLLPLVVWRQPTQTLTTRGTAASRPSCKRPARHSPRAAGEVRSRQHRFMLAHPAHGYLCTPTAGWTNGTQRCARTHERSTGWRRSLSGVTSLVHTDRDRGTKSGRVCEGMREQSAHCARGRAPAMALGVPILHATTNRRPFVLCHANRHQAGHATNKTLPTGSLSLFTLHHAERSPPTLTTTSPTLSHQDKPLPF